VASQLRFSVSEQVADPEWDEYVLSHADPQLEQTALWAEIRLAYGWKPVRLLARLDGKLVGGAQLLEHKIARFFTVGYLPRGPLLSAAVEPALFVGELQRLVRRRRLTYLATSLPYLAHALTPILLRQGFQLRPERLPPAVWVKATSVIALDRDDDALMAAISATKRKQIRRAQKAGIIVRPGSRADLPAFQELLVALCQRRGVASNIPLGPGLNALWDRLAPRGLLKLFVAELNGEPLSAMLLVVVGGWVRTWRIGWSGNHERECPSHLLYWESIRWARQQGCSHFDLLGVDVRDAQELLAGRDRSAPYHCQITYAKTGFGGELLLLPGEYCYFPNRVLALFFRYVGRALLESKVITGFLATLHARNIEGERGQAGRP
jgi:lipid II:glycine glycyltransferase (peptidoglycan interpeptide bridge formation enzyme)